MTACGMQAGLYGMQFVIPVCLLTGKRTDFIIASFDNLKAD